VIGAHLVGGLKTANATTAMRTTSRILGRHVHAVTDGETGVRDQWVLWQLDKLRGVPGIGMGEGTKPMPAATDRVYDRVFPNLTIAESVTALPVRHLGYADAAEDSYLIFQRLREQGVIPEGVKFQVSLPTPYATVVMFTTPDDQERFFGVYENAMADEVRAIAGIVDPDDLVIQFDAAVEIGVMCGAFSAAPKLTDRRFILDRLRTAIAMPPDEVERGAHLCYGDLRHRHFAVPEDLSLCVDVANTISHHSHFVHMPADRDAGRDPKYYEPLRDLKTRRLALGVIDYEGDEARTAELLDAAALGGGRDFAVATECGMARIGERGDTTSLEQLLTLHAKFAAPIR
ncbi:MAG: hypothetical protein ACRDQU_01090, partial [Pseudonocardiaceae bacterium]